MDVLKGDKMSERNFPVIESTTGAHDIVLWSAFDADDPKYANDYRFKGLSSRGCTISFSYDVNLESWIYDIEKDERLIDNPEEKEIVTKKLGKVLENDHTVRAYQPKEYATFKVSEVSAKDERIKELERLLAISGKPKRSKGEATDETD